MCKHAVLSTSLRERKKYGIFFVDLKSAPKGKYEMFVVSS